MPELIRIPRLKKDGSADPELYRPVAGLLSSGSCAVIPVDGIYGVAAKPDSPHLVKKLGADFEYLITDLATLDDFAAITKKDYDFLKRVWPDEVTVALNGKEGGHDPVFVRMPANPVSRDVVNRAGGILVFSQLSGGRGKGIFRKKEIELAAEGCSAVLLIDEWCKAHLPSTIVDIRGEEIRLLRKGRVSMEEVSSLYFLGASED